MKTKISESLFMYLIKNNVMIYVYVINRKTFVDELVFCFLSSASLLLVGEANTLVHEH